MNPTSVVISFPMRDALAVVDLRRRLMRDLDLFDPNSIYMDTVAMRQRPAGRTHHELTAPDNQKRGHTYVFPDVRSREKAASARSEGESEAAYIRRLVATGSDPIPIGARNSKWENLFKAAMKKAGVFLSIITEHYESSDFCKHEYELAEKWVTKDNKHLILMQFSDVYRHFKRPRTGRVTVLRLDRIRTFGGFHTGVHASAPEGASWVLSEGSYKSLLAAIRTAP